MAAPEPRASHSDLPPPLALFQMATAYYVSRAIYVAAELGIADLLAGGPKDAADLAKATSAHAPSLKRVLRLLVSAGVFFETENGRFALTPIGECLRNGPGSFRSAALLFTGPLEWASWGELLHTVRSGETALEHVFGMDTFQYLECHPDEAAAFDEAMAAFTKMTAMAVAASYDFSALSTVIDVGGGNGDLLMGILQAHPHLRGVVFDLPRVIEGARRQIAGASLAGRCTALGGDFFETVPSGGDAYLLKHVIHDWDDQRAATILRNCHRAMPPDGTLLIVEGVYPSRVDQSAASRGAASNDVNMLVCTGGRQRSEAEFRALFDLAGFKLRQIVPTYSAASVIEAAPA